MITIILKVNFPFSIINGDKKVSHSNKEKKLTFPSKNGKITIN